METIDNAWLIPLSRGGVYKIVFCDDRIKIIRIFSGKYIQEKLGLRRDMKYVDSLNVPSATDPLEPEKIYDNIKSMINYITEEYYKDENKDKIDTKTIKYDDIVNIELTKGGKNQLPELTINNEKFILPHKDFDKKPEMNDELYNRYNKIINRHVKK